MPLDRRDPRSTPFLNVLLALAAAALVLGVAEGMARLYERRLPDPEGDRLALWDKEWGDDYYVLRSLAVGWPPQEPVNRHGFPDRTHATEKEAGVFRLAILGDSVTAGTPFKPEESIPYALQALYAERAPWTEVLTVALWGWSTRQERYAFDGVARHYHPDLVLVAVCLNDMEELQNNLSRPSRWFGWLYHRSAFLRRAVNADARSIRDVEELLEDTANTRRAQERFFAEMERLRLRVEAAGARLAVLVFPMQSQVEGRSSSRLPQERVRAFCAARGIPCLDPLEALRGERGLFEDIVHFTLEGRARVARFVFESRLVPDEAKDVLALRRALSPRDPGTAGVEDLVAALRTGADPRARAEAAWLLGRRGPLPGPVVTALLAALDERAEAVRAEAARALGKSGEASARVVDRLARSLDDPRQAVRWRAVEAIVALRPGFDLAWPAVQPGLRSGDAYVRAGAAWCLRDMGPAAAPAASAIRPLVRDPDLGVRIVAVRTLAALGPPDPDTLGALVETLRAGGDDNVRWQAARALGRLGPPAAGATPELLVALRDPNGHVRREAATALGLVRSPQPGVVPALVAATRDEAGFVRRAAALALGRLGAPAPVRVALERLLEDEDASVRQAARQALTRGGALPGPEAPAGEP